MTRRHKKKTRKYYGNRSFGYGNKKNNRGKGNRGGVGRAGIHKHKWTWKIVNEGTLTVPGFINKNSKTHAEVNLDTLNRLAENGKAKQENGAFVFEFKNTKVLGKGELKHKVSVKATSFSKSAKEAIEKLGGTAHAAKAKENAKG